jgi:[acyl-carrier-protein] S-malonyltransferase
MSFGLVFPGQGSQEVGMLADFLASEPVVKDCVAEAEAVLGLALRDLLLDGPDSELNCTEVTQPVLLTASTALWRLWHHRGGPPPAVVAGHSLGEYSALVAAGALEFADGLSLVRRRGQLMQAAVPAGEGAMAAILGLDEATVIRCCESVGGTVSAANINAPGQIVIAGSSAAVAAAIDSCTAAGAKRAMLLSVSVPSHCSLMAPAAAQLAEILEGVSIAEPAFPVVANVDASIASDPLHIRRNLVAQLSRPVRWIDCVQRMVAEGATTLIECGPGRVLTGLIKRIDRGLATGSLASAASFDDALRERAGG